jgi:hypothetical protein
MHKDREENKQLKSDLIKSTHVAFVTQTCLLVKRVIFGSKSRNSVGHSFDVLGVSCMSSGNGIYSELPHVSC